MCSELMDAFNLAFKVLVKYDNNNKGNKWRPLWMRFVSIACCRSIACMARSSKNTYRSEKRNAMESSSFLFKVGLFPYFSRKYPYGVQSTQYSYVSVVSCSRIACLRLPPYLTRRAWPCGPCTSYVLNPGVQQLQHTLQHRQKPGSTIYNTTGQKDDILRNRRL